MKKSAGLKASSLKKLLGFLLVLVTIGVAGGFYLGLHEVRTFSIDVSHVVADSQASGNTISELQQLKQSLSQSEALVTKANQMFSTNANYQSQALTDVRKYASNAGITISNTDFEAGSDAAPSAPVPANGKAFTIKLQSPVSYAKLLQFIANIEGNLPKMQIMGLKVNRVASGTSDQVEVGDIKITISTR